METLEQRISFLMGQVSVLGIGLHAALKHHPNRDDVAKTIRDEFENAYTMATNRPFPEEFISGMESAMSLYLLKDEA